MHGKEDLKRTVIQRIFAKALISCSFFLPVIKLYLSEGLAIDFSNKIKSPLPLNPICGEGKDTKFEADFKAILRVLHLKADLR